MTERTALDGLLEFCDRIRDQHEDEDDRVEGAEALEHVERFGRRLFPQLPGIKALPEAADLDAHELFLLALLLHHRMRAGAEPLEGARLLGILLRAGFPRSEAMAMLGPAHALRVEGWLKAEVPDGGFDPLDAQFLPSPRALQLFWPGALPARNAATREEDEKEADDPATRPYRDEAEYLWDLHGWRNLCIVRADTAFEMDARTLRPSTRNRMHRRRARQRWLRIRRRITITEAGREFALERFMREHGLGPDHVLLIVHLMFGELLEGECAIPAVEGLRLLAETRDDILRKRATIGPDGLLRRLGILHAEGEDYAKMSVAPLALADWAVDRILAGVRRRPQWDEREFEDFLNGDT